MATNPMQRKARNSFLLGMLVMLLITGVIIALLFVQLMNRMKEEKEEMALQVNAYVLKQDVRSGQVITNDMLELVPVNKSLVPSNATSDLTILENYALQDKEGNDVYTKMTSGKEPKLYIRKNNAEYEIKQEETGNYYIEKNSEKEYIELNSVPLIAKVDMNANTLITPELLSKSDSMVQDDRRKQEYNVVVLPMDLATGDYIDIRVLFPNGQDFIVVSKKEVEIPLVGGVDSADTIWVNLSEEEILHMSCAIIDAAAVPGSKIYASKYTEAGMQKAATPTYVANAATLQILQKDPNILQTAMTTVVNRYNAQGSTDIRNNYINSMISGQGEQADTNIQTNMQESITNSKGARKEYLDSLSAPVTTE